MQQHRLARRRVGHHRDESDEAIAGPQRGAIAETPAPGATISAHVRTCATPATCSGAWAGPYADGATPNVVARRYVQMLFAITDTDHDTFLDELILDYNLVGE
jgi:hypothetical protein